MLKERVLLPGVTVLVRLVGEVRRAENERLHALLSGRLSAEMRAALVGLPAVPDGKRRSELERLRTAPTMAAAMEVLMAVPEATEERLVSLVEVWKAIEEVVPREKLASAVETVAEFVPVSDDAAAAQWRAELVKRYRAVQGFIDPLLSTIRFRVVEAGTPVLAMVRAAAVMAKSRRRDVFAEGSERWSDPRARLLDGQAWEQARPRVLTSLELELEPAGHLAELASALEGACTRVLDGLGGNTVVQFVGGRLRLEKLGPLAEPPLMKELRSLVDGMLPRLDFPELLLEVFDRTGLPADFTHVSGIDAAMDDFPMSLAALVVAEACNVGLVPIENPNVPALTRARLQQVDQGYLRAETIAAANARLIGAQAGIGIVRHWGNGHIASADGLRFVVPVASLHAGHNPVYFARRRDLAQCGQRPGDGHRWAGGPGHAARLAVHPGRHPQS